MRSRHSCSSAYLTRIKAKLSVDEMILATTTETTAMRYKTILVQLDIDVPAFPRLTFAWDLARRFDANLIGFCAAEPRMLIPERWTAPRPSMLRKASCGDRRLLEKRKAEFDSFDGRPWSSVMAQRSW